MPRGPSGEFLLSVNRVFPPFEAPTILAPARPASARKTRGSLRYPRHLPMMCRHSAPMLGGRYVTAVSLLQSHREIGCVVVPDSKDLL